MLEPTWLGLCVMALAGGAMVILTPKLVLQLNSRLNRVLVSFDETLLRYRHVIGVLLLVVAYLCFRLALLVPLAAQ